MRNILRLSVALTAIGAAAAALAACRPASQSSTTGSETRQPVELRVSAAVSLSEALERIGAELARDGRARARLNLAGSNTLAAQILEGADVDVFVSADAAQMDRVERAGRLLAGTRVDLLSNSLVVLTPSDRVGTLRQPRDLLDAKVRRIAVGDPAAVPAGVYARQYLERAHIWTAIQPKLVVFPHVRAVVAAIATGAADAGIVYRTDARVARHAHIAWEVATDEGPPILYPAAVIQGSKQTEAARAYVRFLQSPAATKIFADAGFTPLTIATAIRD